MKKNNKKTFKEKIPKRKRKKNKGKTTTPPPLQATKLLPPKTKPKSQLK